MKVLSAVACIFLPLTLVAGIYGMNFEHMPELGWSWAYFGVLVFMGAAIVVSTWWFLTHGWIRIGPRPVVHEPRFAVDPNALVGRVRSVANGASRSDDDGAAVAGAMDGQTAECRRQSLDHHPPSAL